MFKNWKKLCVNINGIKNFIEIFNTEILKKENLFYNWKHLKLIIIPKTIKKIDEWCFGDCVRLEVNWNISSGVEILTYNCFKNCYNLRSIKFTDGTAFIGCINLENIFEMIKLNNYFKKFENSYRKKNEIEIENMKNI